MAKKVRKKIENKVFLMRAFLYRLSFLRKKASCFYFLFSFFFYKVSINEVEDGDDF